MDAKASRQAAKGQVKRLQGQQRNHLCQEPWDPGALKTLDDHPEPATQQSRKPHDTQTRFNRKLSNPMTSRSSTSSEVALVGGRKPSAEQCMFTI
jgi:hypothetical protein